MSEIVSIKKSIIPSCDVSSLARLEEIVRQTNDIKLVSAYKIGFELALAHGLPKTVKAIRKHADKPIIYDHQKAANDIPEMGEKFAAACKQSGIDAAIIFPFTGPKTEEKWIDAIQKHGLGLIVGGEMTHEKFLSTDGGYIEPSVPKKIFELAAKKGATNFVVPGNKPEKIKEYRKFFEKLGVKPVFFSPGFVVQGGNIKEAINASPNGFHAIIGRAIYDSKSIRSTALELVNQL